MPRNSQAIITLFALATLISGCSIFHAPVSPQAAKNQSVQDNKASDHSLNKLSLDKKDQATVATKNQSSALNKNPNTKNNDPTKINLWNDIVRGYGLPKIDNKAIQAQQKTYGNHPHYLDRISKRASPYLYYIVSELKRRDMPLELALLPIVESAYDPFAYSHGNASGLWQFTAQTATQFKLKNSWWYDGRRDVMASTNAALDYLVQLNKRFDGSWLLALAAYNAGGGTVNKAIRKNKKLGKATDYWSLDLPKETKKYVPRLIAIANIIAAPEKYKLQLTPVKNIPYFKRIDVGFQIDLAKAAKLSKLNIEQLYLLNPGYNRWATSPSSATHLLVPVAQSQKLLAQLKSIKPQDRLNLAQYTVKKGDSLGKIASQNNILIDELRTINGLSSSRIKAGQTLYIPTASESASYYVSSLDKRRKPTSSNKIQRYTVRSGDNLWTISRRYNVRYEDLARWNKMSPKETLKLGKRLVIYPSSAAYAKGKTQVSYHVRKGDSIAKIAKRFGISIAAIVKANSLNPKNYLQPGQALQLLVTSNRG